MKKEIQKKNSVSSQVEMTHLNLKLLMMLQIHLSVSDDLNAGLVDNALRFDPVPTNGRPYLCPADPIECT